MSRGDEEGGRVGELTGGDEDGEARWRRKEGNEGGDGRLWGVGEGMWNGGHVEEGEKVMGGYE